MKKFSVCLLLLGIFLLSGCKGASNQTLPTLIPSPAPATDVPTQATTALPTATEALFDRATLPPTWTVSPIPSETPVPSLDATVQAQLAAPTLVVCGVFAVDRELNPEAYTVGQPLTVVWTPVDTASRYRVSLVSETGSELFFDYALEPTYTFQSNLFVRGGRYAWEVYPEDAQNQQMCIKRGGELLPPP
jgi:hypothetical protein